MAASDTRKTQTPELTSLQAAALSRVLTAVGAPDPKDLEVLENAAGLGSIARKLIEDEIKALRVQQEAARVEAAQVQVAERKAVEALAASASIAATVEPTIEEVAAEIVEAQQAPVVVATQPVALAGPAVSPVAAIAAPSTTPRLELEAAPVRTDAEVAAVAAKQQVAALVASQLKAAEISRFLKAAVIEETVDHALGLSDAEPSALAPRYLVEAVKHLLEADGPVAKAEASEKLEAAFKYWAEEPATKALDTAVVQETTHVLAIERSAPAFVLVS